MATIPLGHRISRELSRRGGRRTFFWPAQYRELRRIDSVDDLADFLDRTGYSGVRASDNVEEIANDIELEANSPGIVDPAIVRVLGRPLSLLLLPLGLCWRVIAGGRAK